MHVHPRVVPAEVLLDDPRLVVEVLLVFLCIFFRDFEGELLARQVPSDPTLDEDDGGNETSILFSGGVHSPEGLELDGLASVPVLLLLVRRDVYVELGDDRVPLLHQLLLKL